MHYRASESFRQVWESGGAANLHSWAELPRPYLGKEGTHEQRYRLIKAVGRLWQLTANARWYSDNSPLPDGEYTLTGKAFLSVCAYSEGTGGIMIAYLAMAGGVIIGLAIGALVLWLVVTRSKKPWRFYFNQRIVPSFNAARIILITLYMKGCDSSEISLWSHRLWTLLS